MGRKKSRKLSLKKETLRVLSDEQLEQAQGGRAKDTGVALTLLWWVCWYCSQDCPPAPQCSTERCDSAATCPGPEAQ